MKEMATRKAAQPVSVEIPSPTIGLLEIGVVGLTPFICERMAEKAKRELLLPKGRKTTAEKATTLKHAPEDEFRESPYTFAEQDAPTLLAFLPAAFKRAMATAALDVPGATRTQTERLIWANGRRSSLYGIPHLSMEIVRCADMNRTPDIRSRAILPRWAMKLEISFVAPQLTAAAVSNLLATAGYTVGVGGWRVEKGSGNFGQFRICDLKDPELLAIIKESPRKAQERAMREAAPFDHESAELLEWYHGELERRGRTTTTANGKASKSRAREALAS